MALRDRLDRLARLALRQWVRTLPPETRASLRVASWRDQPLELVAMPVDPEAAHEQETWSAQLREYVNSHEEIGFFLQQRHFHICRAHPAARRVIATGVIPAGFTCPRRAGACPFAAASACASGQALRLQPRTAASGNPRC